MLAFNHCSSYHCLIGLQENVNYKNSKIFMNILHTYTQAWKWKTVDVNVS